MNGQLLYDMAKQRADERVQQSSRRSAARAARAAARAQHGTEVAPAPVPAIPDFAHEMFQAAGDAVPPPRAESADGRHARTAGSA